MTQDGIFLDLACGDGCFTVPVGSFGTKVVANSVLHLISNPEKVVEEIHRVLKKDGCFICIDDVPGKDVASTYDNSEYNNIVNSMYGEYWQALNIYGITPKKYSWRFDRNGYCDGVFNIVFWLMVGMLAMQLFHQQEIMV